jgi:DNA-directed RNA polymerase subunit beta
MEQNYSARVIPFKGSWIEFSTDNQCNVRLYRQKEKLPVTTLFRAIGFERDKDILEILTLLRKLKFLKQDLKNISVEN